MKNVYKMIKEGILGRMKDGTTYYRAIILNKYKNHLTPIKLPLFIIFITDLKSIWCLLSMRELLGWGPVSADRHQLRHLAAKVKTKGWQGWKHVIKSLVPPWFQIILLLDESYLKILHKDEKKISCWEYLHNFCVNNCSLEV